MADESWVLVKLSYVLSSMLFSRYIYDFKLNGQVMLQHLTTMPELFANRSENALPDVNARFDALVNQIG